MVEAIVGGFLQTHITLPSGGRRNEEREGEKEEEEEERRVLRLAGKHKLTVWERGSLDERFSIFIKEQTSLGQESPTSPAEERRLLDLSKCLSAVQKAQNHSFPRSSDVGVGVPVKQLLLSRPAPVK